MQKPAEGKEQVFGGERLENMEKNNNFSKNWIYPQSTFYSFCPVPIVWTQISNDFF